VLESLIEGTRIPDREEVVLALASRPRAAFALEDRNREFHVHRDLESGPDDLTVPLERVPVAQEEEGPGNEDREERGCLWPVATVVHVPAMPARRGRADRFTTCGSDPEASEHGLELEGQPAEPRREQQGRRSRFTIDPPRSAKALFPESRKLGHVIGVDRVGCDGGRAPCRVAIRPDLVQVDGQAVARLGACDEERPGLRIAELDPLLAARIAPCGIEGGRAYRVAVLDLQHRIV